MKRVLTASVVLMGAASSLQAANSYAYIAVPQVTSPDAGQVFNVDLYIRETVTGGSLAHFLDAPAGDGALVAGGFVVSRSLTIPASPSKLTAATAGPVWDAATDASPSDSNVDLSLTTFNLFNTVQGTQVSPGVYDVFLGTATVQAGDWSSSTSFALDQHPGTFDDFVYQSAASFPVIDTAYSIAPASFTVNVATFHSEWSSAAGGNWSTAGNWTNGSPGAIDHIANFKNHLGAITSPVTVTLDSAVSVGTINFDNTNKYTLAGTAAVTISSSTSGAINVVSGSHEITAPVALASNTTIAVTGATDSLKLTKLQPATVNITKSGAGMLVVNSLKTAGVLSITNGTLEVPLNGGASGVSSAGTISISGIGRIELHDNDLITNYGPGNPSNYTAIVNYLKSGLAILGGNPDGPGIGSSEVDAQTIPGALLAVVDDGAPEIGGAITEMSGFTVPAPNSSVLVKYTWLGDSNLDGAVDAADYALIDTGFTSGGMLGGWVFGDYDYDGAVGAPDYALIDTGFIVQNAVLPEPSLLGLATLGCAILGRRR